MEYVAAAKTGFDMLRSVIGLVRDVGTALPADKKEAITRSLEEADKQLRLAEATIADTLGYTLCRCAFPPSPMLLVGYRTEYTPKGRQLITVEIHECPVCKRNDAAEGLPWKRYEQTGDGAPSAA